MVGLFTKRLPFGTICIVVLCSLSISSSIVSSQSPRRNNIQRTQKSQNETILDDINATGEIVKRVGEFASRALWVRKGKFILPTGTILTLAPKITIPAFRRKAFKGGLNSDFQATWFLYLNCDKMGFTHEMHPFPFDRPPFYPFGPLMRPIESKDGDKKDKDKEKPGPGGKPVQQFPSSSGYGEDTVYPMDPSYSYQTISNGDEAFKHSSKSDKSDKIYTFFPIHQRTGLLAAAAAQQKEKQSTHAAGEARGNVRKPRSVMSLPPPDKLPGGERAILLPSIENMMSNFGFEGRGCMLRAICEIHQFPLQQGYGLLGEMIALFFSISQSPYAESHMPEYLKAEESGRNGDCSAYKTVCAKSIFKWEVAKNHYDDDAETNEIPSSPLRSKYEDDEL